MYANLSSKELALDKKLRTERYRKPSVSLTKKSLTSKKSVASVHKADILED